MTLVDHNTNFRANRPQGAGASAGFGTPASSHSFPSPTLQRFQDFLLIMPVLLFSVIAHEYAHGYAALKQGDNTALMLGRLTWNPIKHIDPFMTILLPLMLWIAHGPLLGGAKPVPVNPRNYRNFKRGDIIVSLAGVFVNLLLAFAFVIVFVLVGLIGRQVPAALPTLGIVQAMMLQGLFMNLVLIAFNLIPIPPLDGSHVMKYLLPPSWALRYQQVGRYGIVILLILLALPNNVLTTWMRPAMIFGGVLMEWARPYSLPTLSQWLS